MSKEFDKRLIGILERHEALSISVLKKENTFQVTVWSIPVDNIFNVYYGYGNTPMEALKIALIEAHMEE